MRAKAIIRDVMRAYMISPEDFFSQRRVSNLVAARAEAALKIRALGFSRTKIGEFMKRSPETISYYINPNVRGQKKAYKDKRWAQKAALRILSADVRVIVEQFAQAENTPPIVIIAEWVRERAEHEEQARRQAA